MSPSSVLPSVAAEASGTHGTRSHAQHHGQTAHTTGKESMHAALAPRHPTKQRPALPPGGSPPAPHVDTRALPPRATRPARQQQGIRPPTARPAVAQGRSVARSCALWHAHHTHTHTRGRGYAPGAAAGGWFTVPPRRPVDPDFFLFEFLFPMVNNGTGCESWRGVGNAAKSVPRPPDFAFVRHVSPIIAQLFQTFRPAFKI